MESCGHGRILPTAKPSQGGSAASTSASGHGPARAPCTATTVGALAHLALITRDPAQCEAAAAVARAVAFWAPNEHPDTDGWERRKGKQMFKHSAMISHDCNFQARAHRWAHVQTTTSSRNVTEERCAEHYCASLFYCSLFLNLWACSGAAGPCPYTRGASFHASVLSKQVVGGCRWPGSWLAAQFLHDQAELVLIISCSFFRKYWCSNIAHASYACRDRTMAFNIKCKSLLKKSNGDGSVAIRTAMLACRPTGGRVRTLPTPTQQHKYK
jgi:hypothetical protein